MRLTKITFVLTAFGVVLVYLAEGKPKAQSLQVKAHVGISIDSDKSEGRQAPSRQALSNIKSTIKEDTPETGSADVPCIQDGIDGICHRGDNPDGGSCCDGLECVDYEPTELNNKCMKCGEKGDKCNSENHRFPRCCAGLKCHEKSMACIRGTVGH